MSEQKEEVVEQITKVEETGPVSLNDGVIKVNLSELNKVEETVVPEEVAPIEEVVVEEITEAIPNTVEESDSLIEEITNEEVVERVEELEEQFDEALDSKHEDGIELPENIQKVVDFMNETNGTLEDYVKLNQDYSKLNESQLLREYYENTKPHLDKEDIDFLMDDNFSYDEELDEERDIKRKQVARREELAKAKDHLEGMKSKYYEQIKGGSRLAPEQKKAVDFFNRYNEENAEATKKAEHYVSTFNKKTESVFSEDFKGFDYSVGEKKFRFKVNDAEQVKTDQSNINNFVKKFLNDKNEMSDAKGYHKSLFTAMNPDKVAQHFYEQGKADAMKDSIKNSKNINMDPRGTHEKVNNNSGFSVRAVTDSKTSKFGFKTKK
tara:strand:- start:5906 stop:7045 length:1140 start_codon:yes stop_codon:yes gene_type:complete